MEALGIVAIVLSLIGVFTPFFGVFIAGLSGLFAIFACKRCNQYALAAVILNLVNMIFLSPKLLLVVFSSDKASLFDFSEIKYAFLITLLIQVIAIVTYVKNRRQILTSNT